MCWGPRSKRTAVFYLRSQRPLKPHRFDPLDLLSVEISIKSIMMGPEDRVSPRMSASRFRRSLGDSVDEVVSHSLKNANNNTTNNSSTTSYTPSAMSSSSPRRTTSPMSQLKVVHPSVRRLSLHEAEPTLHTDAKFVHVTNEPSPLGPPMGPPLSPTSPTRLQHSSSTGGSRQFLQQPKHQAQRRLSLSLHSGPIQASWLDSNVHRKLSTGAALGLQERNWHGFGGSQDHFTEESVSPQDEKGARETPNIAIGGVRRRSSDASESGLSLPVPPDPRRRFSIEVTDVDAGHSSVKSSTKIRKKGKNITVDQAIQLKQLVLGTAMKSWPNGWLDQNFQFSSNPGLRFGLIQHQGGPCGVLAAVQAHLLLGLIYGLNEDPGARVANPLIPSDSARQRALVSALATILHRCSHDSEICVAVSFTRKAKFVSAAGRYRVDGLTESLEVFTFGSFDETKNFIEDNLQAINVVTFLYSVILTRGVGDVRNDMDSKELCLMAEHGYCSQEMVNLMLVGKAVSNVFDYDVELEQGVVLKGVQNQSDIGLLSLFEHYQSCKVGDHLKSPQWPIWLICSESHFSVLFSTEPGATKTSLADRRTVRVHYYDGLNHNQDELITLSIDTADHNGDKEEAPPLELCIRTKWVHANIDWNGAEKIL